MKAVNPVADEWTDEYCLFAASSRSVLLTEPLAQFLAYAASVHLRPVLVSGSDASLSPFVTMAMLRAGGFWAVHDPRGGVYNGLSGERISQVPDLWGRGDAEGERLGALSTIGLTPAGVLMFDVYGHQRASAGTLVGQMGTDLVRHLGGGELDVWGLYEPLLEPWNVRRVTETARRGMPDSDPILARAADGSFCQVQVARTPRGLLEQAKGGVPVGGYPAGLGPVVETASAALTLIAEAYQPTIGFVSLAEFDPGVVQGVSAKRPEAPLAVFIGPRAVHEMSIDIDRIVRQHDATVLGRARVPSILVRFSDAEHGLWDQLAYLAYNIGPGKILAAAGIARKA